MTKIIKIVIDLITAPLNRDVPHRSIPTRSRPVMRNYTNITSATENTTDYIYISSFGIFGVFVVLMNQVNTLPPHSHLAHRHRRLLIRIG